MERHLPGYAMFREGCPMANKVDPNKNDNVYNPDTGFEKKPSNLPKNKRRNQSK